jgi:hypothetical protein
MLKSTQIPKLPFESPTKYIKFTFFLFIIYYLIIRLDYKLIFLTCLELTKDTDPGSFP